MLINKIDKNILNIVENNSKKWIKIDKIIKNKQHLYELY
jgi:hypothetical protein